MLTKIFEMILGRKPRQEFVICRRRIDSYGQFFLITKRPGSFNCRCVIGSELESVIEYMKGKNTTHLLVLVYPDDSFTIIRRATRLEFENSLNRYY